MRSKIVHGLAAILIAASLAACNSGGTLTNPAATPSPSPSPTGPVTPGPGQAFFTSAGGSLALGPYANAGKANVTLASTWGSNNQQSTTFQGALSAGSSDLNPPSSTWFAYNGAGAPIIYLEFTAFPAASFTQSPGLTFTTSAPVPGSACSIAYLNGTWQTVISGGVISNASETVTFAAQAFPSGFIVGNLGSPFGPDYLALVCQ